MDRNMMVLLKMSGEEMEMAVQSRGCPTVEKLCVEELRNRRWRGV